MNHHGYLGENGGRLKYSHNPQHRNLMGFQTVKISSLEMNRSPLQGTVLVIALKTVVFPAPLGPIRPNNSPG